MLLNFQYLQEIFAKVLPSFSNELRMWQRFPHRPLHPCDGLTKAHVFVTLVPQPLLRVCWHLPDAGPGLSWFAWRIDGESNVIQMQIWSSGLKSFVPQVKCLIHYIHGRLRVRVLVYVGDDLNSLNTQKVRGSCRNTLGAGCGLHFWGQGRNRQDSKNCVDSWNSLNTIQTWSSVWYEWIALLTTKWHRRN